MRDLLGLVLLKILHTGGRIYFVNNILVRC